MIDWIRRWRDEVGDTHALAAARVALGLLLLAAAMRAEAELRSGYFGDFFHWPIVPEALVPSRAVYEGLVGSEVIAAAMVIAGVEARAALIASAVIGTYVLSCDRLHFHHNRWALACYAMLLGLSPCDRSLALQTRANAVDAGTKDPLWAARLAQLQVSIIYVASAGSKLLDPDWRDGRVLATRVALYGQNAIDAGVPAWVVARVAEPGVAGALAAAAIATELFLSAGLWSRRTRVIALWCGVWFHLTIEATSRVEGFTWLTLAMYALFATPNARSRTIEVDRSRPGEWRLAKAVEWLDWLARFEVRARPTRVGCGLVVVDRAGRRSRGTHALAAVAQCTPLLFPLWLPLAAIAALDPRDHTMVNPTRSP